MTDAAKVWTIQERLRRAPGEDILREAADHIDKLEARVKELEGALKPFGNSAARWDTLNWQGVLIERFPDKQFPAGECRVLLETNPAVQAQQDQLKIGDFRRARAALSDSGETGLSEIAFGQPHQFNDILAVPLRIEGRDVVWVEPRHLECKQSWRLNRCPRWYFEKYAAPHTGEQRDE